MDYEDFKASIESIKGQLQGFLDSWFEKSLTVKLKFLQWWMFRHAVSDAFMCLMFIATCFARDICNILRDKNEMLFSEK